MPVPLFRLGASRMEQKDVWRGGVGSTAADSMWRCSFFVLAFSFFDIIYYF
ncbi:hypothetical protein LR69_02683 [Geobacillus sp. BCO2]|nr:hypothetical protein LR69_02683 [Geobacillus sp. BCO2]